MNNFFYSVTYHANHRGKRTKTSNILFSTTAEITDDGIKNYILKKLKKPKVLVTLHSVNTFPRATFIHLGGDPDEPFE